MPETKNVLELMTEMLHEQENHRMRSNNCAIDNHFITNIDGDEKTEESYENKVKFKFKKFSCNFLFYAHRVLFVNRFHS